MALRPLGGNPQHWTEPDAQMGRMKASVWATRTISSPSHAVDTKRASGPPDL